jgi:hypothetical protein
MQLVNRIVGVLLISCVGAAPLGVAAEGYVCASGARMVHNTSAPACTHCSASASVPVRAAFESPCCTYVGSASLPPVMTVASSGVPAAHRSVLIATPGVTAIAGPAHALGAIPQFDSGGSGSSPPAVSLQRSVQLRN